MDEAASVHNPGLFCFWQRCVPQVRSGTEHLCHNLVTLMEWTVPSQGQVGELQGLGKQVVENISARENSDNEACRHYWIISQNCRGSHERQSKFIEAWNFFCPKSGGVLAGSGLINSFCRDLYSSTISLQLNFSLTFGTNLIDESQGYHMRIFSLLLFNIICEPGTNYYWDMLIEPGGKSGDTPYPLLNWSPNLGGFLLGPGAICKLCWKILLPTWSLSGMLDASLHCVSNEQKSREKGVKSLWPCEPWNSEPILKKKRIQQVSAGH